jgi:hypothetical protein
MSLNDKKYTQIENEDDLMRMIGELALTLHMNRTEELSCEMPADKPCPSQKETADYLINDNTIRFSSIDVRNRTVANYLFQKHKNAIDTNMQMWLSTAHDLWRCEIGKSDSAAGRLLGIVHEIDDIFFMAADAIKNKSMGVFDVLHTVEASLPFLKKIEPDGIFELCAAQHDATKNDLLGGRFFGKLENVLVTRPDLCRLIHARLRSDIAEATSNLHTTALLALARTSPGDAVMLAQEDAKSPNTTLKMVALWTLGRLLALSQVAGDEIGAVSAVIIANMSNSTVQIRRTSIHAAAQTIPAMSVFDDTLLGLGESGDQDALGAIANILIHNIQEMKNKANFNEWVGLLHKLSPLAKGAIDNYDYILTQLMSDASQHQFVISKFTEWAITNAKDTYRDRTIAELFNSTVSELANRPGLLSQVITDWLLSDGRQLASSAAGLLSHLWVHGFKKPEFSVPRLDALEERDLVFLARRMLGFIYSEDHLLSLTMSLLKTKEAQKRTFGIVYSILADEIGQDYPASVVEALESANSIATDSEWRAFYSKVINNINGRMKAIEDLPRLIELRPPPTIQRKFATARAKQMNTVMEESQKKSIIRQLATEIPIKAGHGWFSYREGSYTDSSKMHPFSHSVSVPRRHVLDTVGYDISRFLMRLAKRGEI